MSALLCRVDEYTVGLFLAQTPDEQDHILPLQLLRAADGDWTELPVHSVGNHPGVGFAAVPLKHLPNEFCRIVHGVYVTVAVSEESLVDQAVYQPAVLHKNVAGKVLRLAVEACGN